MGRTANQVSVVLPVEGTPNSVVTLAEYVTQKDSIERKAAKGEQIAIQDQARGLKVLIGSRRRSAEEIKRDERAQAEADAAIMARPVSKKPRRKIDLIFDV